MEYLNGLPLYKATVDSEDTGMLVMSLVDIPATDSFFLAFEKQKELIKFSVQDEEKRIVRGLVMAADMPIYRRDPSGYEYYVSYEAETLRKMAEKYLKMGLQNNVDLNHSENLVDGCYMVQMFIKDSINGINPKGFEDYKDGSLFAEYHIENDDVWNEIKKGTFKGFSLMGVFDLIPSEYVPAGTVDPEEQEYNECVELIEKINKKLKRN